jgi:hypothetical protein
VCSDCSNAVGSMSDFIFFTKMIFQYSVYRKEDEKITQNLGASTML